MEPQPALVKLERRVAGIEWTLRRVQIAVIAVATAVIAVGAAVYVAL